MSANPVDILAYDEPRIICLPAVQSNPSDHENYGWHICQSIFNMIGRLCIGIVVGICLAFAFRNGLPLTATNQHIVVCVIGYQLLMAEACLALAPGSWASNFTLVDKRRVHWILQLVGSILAIAGSVLKSIDNNVNWFSYHGQFGLVAVGFTILSLINGFTSLYAYELSRIIPGNLSKLTHICFGVVAFLTSCISLIYGMKKASFVAWMPVFNSTLIGLTIALAMIVNINPFLTFFQKSKSVLRRMK
ncbi:uncharacterized protein LOC113233534 [Hyposmocoma kahamanoa]|uniref:uncharacterized protein LOC113233534 n=1 Tax=Hyposmocoma kahamanoa TaxID=1477025 RepID=UPI000E6D7368|nr:uncharacterized protein LOC113233534 [Hyposmocoma kahamanoa]